MGLDYDYPTDGSKACSKKPLKVKLDGKHCGEIRKVKDGFQYYPKGEKNGGDIFAGISAVQNSLQTIQPARHVAKVGGDTDEEIMKQAKAGLKKQEAQIKELNARWERANVLLKAAHELLTKQKESKTVLNLLEEMTVYDDAECDGFSLLEDIKEIITE